MKRTKGILSLIILLAILLLAIGYAAISTKDLKIENVAVSAEGSQDDFKVYFNKGEIVTADTTSYVEISNITSDFSEEPTKVTFSVSGMRKVGDKATVKFTVKNDSPSDIKATLSDLTDEWTTGKYFDVESTNWSTKEIISGSEAIVTVTVKCIETPITEVSDTVTLSFTATPSSN